MKIAIVSGGFDPLHSGHLAYIEAAAKLGNELWVCLNSDEWLTAKKGKAFMCFEERKSVLEALRYVDKVMIKLKILNNQEAEVMSVCNKKDSQKVLLKILNSSQVVWVDSKHLKAKPDFRL